MDCADNHVDHTSDQSRDQTSNCSGPRSITGSAGRRGIRTQTTQERISPGADIVVEATGSAGGFATARALVRPRGTLVLKSTFHGDVTLDLIMVVVDEVTIVGSRCGPFPPALRLLEQRLVDVEPLIHETFSLDDSLVAFERAAAPGVLKVLLTT